MEEEITYPRYDNAGNLLEGPPAVPTEKEEMVEEDGGILNATCKTKYKMSPSSVRSEGGEAAAGYCLNSVNYRVDEAVKYNVLNSD